MEDRLRKFQGEDQLELYPPPSFGWYKVAIVVTRIMVVGIWNGRQWVITPPIEQYTMFKTNSIPA